MDAPPTRRFVPLIRRFVPAPLRRLRRRVLVRLRLKRMSSRRLDAETNSRIFELALPKFPAGSSPARTRLQVNAPVDLSVARALWRKGLGGYAPEALGTLLACLEREGASGTFFDIGSNIGPFCFLVAAITDWKVVAFEPTPQIAAVAEGIRDANGLSYDVEELALADQEGEAELFLSSTSDSSNSLRSDFRKSEASLTVPISTLDAYCRRRSLRPNLLKIDTEATEPAVLRGGLDLLSTQRPWIISEVLLNRTEPALEEILRPLEYRWYHIQEGGHLEQTDSIKGDPDHRFNDWFFAPDDIDKDFRRSVRSWSATMAKLPIL
ncbi:MAG: FkbM family methyltransferase [Actinomycetota bacterium]